MNLFISLIGLACVVAPGLAQRNIRQGQQCYTPENDIGQCFTLSYCPAIANVLNEYPRNIATQYLRTAQRNCGNVNFRGDPVVCCNVNQQQQFQTPPTTSNPRNPFFPTAQPQTTLPPIIINPTPAPPQPQPTPQTTTNAPIASTTEGISNREEKSGRECRGPDLKYGTCIPLAQCPSLIERLRANPKDATFANYLRASNDVCKGEYAVVCCPGTNQKQIMQVVVPKNTGAIPTKLLTKADGCGYTLNKFKKIVGGVASKVGAWPWIALLGYEDGVSPKSFKCGGALITSRHVLTAAHCIRKDLTSVRLGEHDLNSETEANHVDIPVVKRLRHPNYVPAYGHNDIAMLYLGQTVQFSENITPICIPTDPQLRAKDLTTLNPFVAGWGKTQEGGVSSNILQELQIPIFGNDECKELYRKQNKLIADDQFDNAVLCAGNLAGGKDTCQGDSGGPLMLPESYGDSFRFNLIGIVSYGIGCARPLIPGVYARVTNFIEWIENSVADTTLAQCPSLIERLRANPKDATFANYLRASNDVCKGEYAVVCCPGTNQKQIMQVVVPKNTGAIPTKLLTKADGCGYTLNKFKKIVGGVASKVGAWPWIALLGYEDGVSPKSFKCGGALITSRHVLTAAHCIRKDLTSVRLGEHDLSSETEANHVDIPVVKRLRHPNYVPAYGHNDIAILYLGQNVQFSENITPICIPTDPQLRAKDLTTLNPFVAGWGKTQEGGVSANILQELQIPIFGNDECKELYRKQNKLIADDQFDNAVLCAGNLAGGKDTCQGDSGGPLMLPESYGDSFRFNLIGIVSYGIGCARPLIPGVYARVTNFIEWIENSVADTSSF